MVVIVMGVAGAGKTTVGRALADALRWRFLDADDFHSPANKAKMHAGIPLTDEDRAPWLSALHDAIARAADRRESLVLACSALKERYRQQLRGDLREIRFVYLKAPTAGALASRLSHRAGHFAGVSLLESQLATLEEPADAVVVDATWPPGRIVDDVRHELGV